MYQMKIGQARTQGEATKQRFLEQKSELEILTKSKQELEDLMPKSEAGEQIENMPASKAIKQALDNLD